VLRDIWTKTLWDHRRALLGWAVGLLAVTLIYGGFYPFVATPSYAELMDNLPPGLAEAMGWDDISSPAGYLGATVFGILGPVLTIVFSIGTGARAIAGEEENGHLELLIAQPVTRTEVVVQRAFALLVALLSLGLVVWLGMVALRGSIDLEIPLAHLAAASLNLALLGATFGALALFVGGFTGRRGLVIGVSAGVAVLAYLANGVAPQVEAIAWMQELSPFHWFDGSATLRDGFRLGDTALLAGVAVALVMGAAVAFSRRDVGT
jgi:ABC-2 type transport system permease protein